MSRSSPHLSVYVHLNLFETQFGVCRENKNFMQVNSDLSDVAVGLSDAAWPTLASWQRVPFTKTPPKTSKK